MTTWLKILDRQAKDKGNAVVAWELGVSPATISLLRSNKYPAKTDKIEKKIMAIYGGASGLVACPVLGGITPARCARHWECAGRIGLKTTNPQTLKLYKTCLKCEVRS